MLQQYEIRRFTQRCAATDRRLEPGEPYFSVLLEGPKGAERRDLSVESWSGAPAECLGWWRAVVPQPGAKPAAAPNEVLLGLLSRWEGDAGRAELRYVLALLLLRRRVVRLDQNDFLDALAAGEAGGGPDESLRLYCPATDASYDVAAAAPPNERLEAIEQSLAELLHTEAA